MANLKQAHAMNSGQFIFSKEYVALTLTTVLDCLICQVKSCHFISCIQTASVF